MAHGYSYLSGDLDASEYDPSRSQSTICLPSPSPIRRVSTYYPKKGPEAVEDSNLDPFYLESSLTETSQLRDVRFNEEANEYYMLSNVNSGVDLSSGSPKAKSKGARRPVHRSTLSQLDFEHTTALNQYATHHSQDSFGSVQTDATTPDLTPSSSFSSTYSGSLCPDSVLKATEQLSLHAAHARQAPSEASSNFYLPPSTPPSGQRSASSTVPGSPTRADIPPITLAVNESSETLTMHHRANTVSSSSDRSKPLPNLPSVTTRSLNGHPGRKSQNHGSRSHIDPSMISPPSLINPVTLEPHTSHFDQAFFIPANECPSPVPSPVANSPPIARQLTVASCKERPSTSTSEALCEQSVWESDSDSESVGPKSLSRKPIDTLRKVRSRVQLRVARSATRLNAAIQDEPALERFPSLQRDRSSTEPLREEVRTVIQAPSSQEVFRTNQQTLRLVAPSTTSLVRPRSRNGSTQSEYNIKQSTAAAMQAKSRRQQRSHTMESSNLRRKKLSLCRDHHTSDLTLHNVSFDRAPFFKRVWDSLRVLGCHNDVARDRHTHKAI